MLEFKHTAEETAIEQLVCLPMSKMQRRTMDDELAKILIQLSMNDGSRKIEEEEQPFIYKLIRKRIDACFTFTIEDERVMLTLIMIAESPGKAIIYLWYLQYWCFVNKKQAIDFTIFCSDIFPAGFFSEQDLKTVWDNQKVARPTQSFASDNLLDYAQAGLSIQFKTKKS